MLVRYIMKILCLQYWWYILQVVWCGIEDNIYTDVRDW
jgi:hypothetical protein